MNDSAQVHLRSMALGVIFSILTLLYGFGLGLVFGANEASIKDRLKSSAQSVAATVYENDPGKMKPVLDKSWVYMQRAHLHAGAMGTTALALIVLMAFFPMGCIARKITSAALGVGGLGYSVYWMWAGFRAPGMGGTSQARESLDWLAIPTSGMFAFATLGVLIFFILTLRKPTTK